MIVDEENCGSRLARDPLGWEIENTKVNKTKNLILVFISAPKITRQARTDLVTGREPFRLDCWGRLGAHKGSSGHQVDRIRVEVTLDQFISQQGDPIKEFDPAPV